MHDGRAKSRFHPRAVGLYNNNNGGGAFVQRPGGGRMRRGGPGARVGGAAAAAVECIRRTQAVAAAVQPSKYIGKYGQAGR